jgi:peptidoglycan/xylan/chitin deacetylase (PgdA/CDA1 family)
MYQISLIVLATFIAVVGTEYILGHLIKRLNVKQLKRKCRGKIALTYDDGPSDLLESRLLQVIDKYGVPATFFLNGVRVETMPDRCEALKAAGHQLGLHCYAHLHPWKVAPWCLLADMKKARKIVGNYLTGTPVFRPPYGKITTSLWLCMKLLGYKIVFWTIDSGDTHKSLPDTEAIVDRLVENGGGVVLMHSFDRKPDVDGRQDYVLKLTQRLIEAAKERGLKVCTCAELN